MTKQAQPRYRIKSWQLLASVLLTIEELGQPGELRLLVDEVVTDQQLLQGFSDKDRVWLLQLAKVTA